MMLADYHVHSTFDDGKSPLEQTVQAAVSMGLDTLGFSGHSPLPYENDWAMTPEGAKDYRAEVRRLAEKYAGSIRILCGVEQDFTSVTGTEEYDYVIGSVHSVFADGEELSVDHMASVQEKAVREHFGGDFQAFAEAYYARVGQLAEKLRPDIIGHFDLVSKFNEGGRLFDESDPRYIAAWKKAADRLLASGAAFEINTGAISRGCRTTPYPSAPIRAYLAERGAKFLLCSDSHRADTLCFRFDEYRTVPNLTFLP